MKNISINIISAKKYFDGEMFQPIIRVNFDGIITLPLERIVDNSLICQSITDSEYFKEIALILGTEIATVMFQSSVVDTIRSKIGG